MNDASVKLVRRGCSVIELPSYLSLCVPVPVALPLAMAVGLPVYVKRS